MSNWTQEDKDELVARYQEEMAKFDTDEEKGQNSSEVVKALAEEIGKTPNGVRIILQKADVYIKKTPTAKTATSSGEGSGGKRVNKAQAQEECKNAISLIDPELVDDELISKLTGKAASYFAGVIHKAVELQG
tara:strand:- start:3 stop:401 length:399 start_codon:yes stop_codon:yes gene_type:complete